MVGNSIEELVPLYTKVDGHTLVADDSAVPIGTHGTVDNPNRNEGDAADPT